MNAVVVFDITNPGAPEQVFKLRTPKAFRPHWLAKDPLSNRLILGAELGGEQGFFMLRFDENTGSLGFDPAFSGRDGSGLFAKTRKGYISLRNQDWPHGQTGDAWGHAALFIDN